MAQKGKKGKAKKASRPKPSQPPTHLVQAPPRHIHPPSSEVVLTDEHSLEIVKTVITATVRRSLS